MILAVFVIGLVAGTAVTLGAFWLRWHALAALCLALLAAAAVTVYIVHAATEADGIPPTRYDVVVIAIGASLGSLIPAILLIWMRWMHRTVDTPKNALADDPQDRLQA